MSSEKKPTVFVSYSHKDKWALDLLMPFLEQLDINGHIEPWIDKKIGAGDDWYAQIQDKLESCKVVVLIVTQNFLASRFCKFEEIPVLLQRARKGALRMFPVLFKKCLLDDEPWLKRKQIVSAETPINRLGDEQDDVLTDLARDILDAVKCDSEPPPHVLDKWPIDLYDLRRLPETGSLLFGRREELNLLDTAWDERQTNVVVFTASGGVGKSTLSRVWCEMLAEDHWRGAERAFAWSFYSEGTGRMTSSDTFIDEALRFFGDTPPDGLSPWEKGARLAEWVKKKRTLLVLDGVEPLQSGAVADKGALRDPALKMLLRSLAADNPGLCIVTTREPLVDLKKQTAPTVVHHDLDHVSTLAGRALLRSKRIGGTDAQLEAAVENLGNHALAINLLASYIADTPSPHISTADDLPPVAKTAKSKDDLYVHPRRAMTAWAHRLGDGPELQLLTLVGLFDRPAAPEQIDALITGGEMRGLNNHLQKDFATALGRLRTAGLLAPENTHAPGQLDAHPLVREHFGEVLETQHPKAFKECHRRLYEYLKNSTKELPDTLDEMAPLFAAVHHGCKAGAHQQALDEVYYSRILRREEEYSIHKLGAFGADLAVLSGFFKEPWSVLVEELNAAATGFVLNAAGFRLMALGRLTEAAEPMAAGLAARIAQKNWRNAAISAENLSELHLCRGDLPQAISYAEEGVTHADRSGDDFQQMTKRATLADALHHGGNRENARNAFAEAEKMQQKQEPGSPQLYSLRGYQYCDLLLSEGEARAVQERARQTIKIAIRHNHLISIALDHLSLGRAALAIAIEGQHRDFIEAHAQLHTAVDGLRQAGQQNYLPLGLLARAELFREMGEVANARTDLHEALDITQQGGMRLHEADAHLEFTRLALAEGNLAEAKDHFNTAQQMVQGMQYGRRFDEVEELKKQLAEPKGIRGQVLAVDSCKGSPN